MSNQAAYKQYKQVQVKTANNKKLLLMLYQGCIKFLRIARKAIENNDLESANENLIKAQNIVNELRYTLDMEKGGEISLNLNQLYSFMHSELIKANTKKDVETILTVEKMMLDLLDSWEQIINKPNAKENNNAINING